MARTARARPATGSPAPDPMPDHVDLPPQVPCRTATRRYQQQRPRLVRQIMSRSPVRQEPESCRNHTSQAASETRPTKYLCYPQNPGTTVGNEHTSPQGPELKPIFDPTTIEHLGFKMYSRLPNADDSDDDVVATDRRSINWDSGEAARLRDYLAAILREVAKLRRETRRTAKKKTLRTQFDVDVERWTDTIEDPVATDAVRGIIDVAASLDTEMSDDDRQALIDGLQDVAPEYANLH